jgi:hypothetical protein
MRLPHPARPNKQEVMLGFAIQTTTQVLQGVGQKMFTSDSDFSPMLWRG